MEFTLERSEGLSMADAYTSPVTDGMGYRQLMERQSGDQIYRRSPELVFRRIADECILVPVRESVARLEAIYTLNEVGAHVWERLDGRATVDDLVASIAATFDVTPPQAREDLRRFVRELERAGAVVRVGSRVPGE